MCILNIHTNIAKCLIIGHSILIAGFIYEILQVNKADEIFEIMYNTDVCAILTLL